MFELSTLPQPVIRYGLGLWRRRWVIVAVAWAMALLGWFAVWLLPDKYESRASVFVQTESILDPVMTGVTARPNYERRVEVMTLQLLTRPNVEEVVYRSGLDQEIDTKDPLRRRAELEGLINWVGSHINIDSPRPNYFDISFQYGDPVLSSKVVDAVLNLLIEQDLGASLTESEEARKLLQQQIDQFDSALTEKEKEVAAFRQRNASDLALIEGEKRRRDQIELDLSRLADELALNTRRVTTLRTVLGNTDRETGGTELDNLLVELAALRSQYEDSYPDIQALQARIDELSTESDNKLPSNPEYRRVQNELLAARDTVASIEERQIELKAELDALALNAGQVPAVEAELQRLERDYDQTRKSYEELLQRRDRLVLTESLGAGGKGVEYNVFERPQPALNPVAPPRFLLIVVALFMALGAGALAGALLTFLEKSFTQATELQSAFGLPVLGGLSEVNSAAVRAHRWVDLRRLAMALVALGVLGAIYVYFSVIRLPQVPETVVEANLTSEDVGVRNIGALVVELRGAK
ncbi:MAG: XrtA system polysaccharide chain length determinant [Pseudomonadota bacterium]